MDLKINILLLVHIGDNMNKLNYYYKDKHSQNKVELTGGIK
jgi:hypothetical protein